MLDVKTKTDKTPVLGRMLSKYVGRKASSIENDITKARNHSRQSGNIMRVVFGIDVSKASSEVAILANGEKVHGYTIPNDAIKFNQLPMNLNPEIVYEATGLYSSRLQAFFEDNSYAYTRLNPLESKKKLDSLRLDKTDKIDAEKLATSPFILNHKASYVQESLCQELRDLSNKRGTYLVDKLTKLANQSYCIVKKTSPMMEEVKYYTEELLRLSKRGNPNARKILFKCIHNIASASHTNPCHIADFL